MTAQQQPPSPDDMLILVDEQDRILGYKSKKHCHQGEGTLHRAFSIFLFSPDGRLLLQQRSAQKPLWPLYWSNSVCSHPRQGESYEQAAHRRVQEELGLDTPLRALFAFSYHAAFRDVGSERELCAVYTGSVSDQTIQADPQEIAAWRYVDTTALDDELATRPDAFTPWFIIEWNRIRAEYLDRISMFY